MGMAFTASSVRDVQPEVEVNLSVLGLFFDRTVLSFALPPWWTMESAHRDEVDGESVVVCEYSHRLVSKSVTVTYPTDHSEVPAEFRDEQ